MRRIFMVLCVMFTIGCDEQSTSSEACGDGVIDTGEDCDQFDFGGVDCASLGYHGGQIACDDQCRFVTTECEASGRCGDGIIQESEECDGTDLDSATCVSLNIGFIDGDLGCASDCQYDYSQCISGAACGNGELESTEECDGDLLGEQTCETLGYHGGTLSCDAQCAFNETNCIPFGKCPDGVVQEAYEECDGANLNGASCASLGYNGGALGCTDTCEFDLTDCESSGQCGDGTADPAEECDGDDLKGATCESRGQYGGTLQCTTECDYDVSGCDGFCGDGIIQGAYTETCDGTNVGTITCGLLGYPYDAAGVPACTGQCGFDTSVCLQFVQIVSNSNHVSALTNEGVAYSWGSNDAGQGGINSDSTIIQIATQVVGGITFTALAAGYDHTCGIATGGQAYCWGNNFGGRLGDGTDTQRRSPVAVLGGLSFVSITAGYFHTCALTAAGGAYCWGSNSQGQLGDSTSTGRYLPTAVSGGLTFSSISAGNIHTCAVTAAGDAYCWGSNGSGRLGDGTTTARNVPTLVSGSLTFASITAGYDHTCAVTTGNVGYCWGSNEHGKLGDGTTTGQSVPTAVSGSTSFSMIDTGWSHSCGIAITGDAYCWGSNNGYQIGDGSMSTGDYLTPTHTWGGQLYARVAAGFTHTCFHSLTGVAYCTGSDQYGQQGIEGTATHIAPNPITSPF